MISQTMRTPPAPGLLLTAGALIEQLRECSVPAAELAVPPPTDQLPEHCRRASQLLELPKKLQDWCICRWTGWCSHCQGAAAGMRAVMMSSPLHPALHYGRDEDVEKGPSISCGCSPRLFQHFGRSVASVLLFPCSDHPN